jgi:hypothetical protein
MGVALTELTRVVGAGVFERVYRYAACPGTGALLTARSSSLIAFAGVASLSPVCWFRVRDSSARLVTDQGRTMP